MKATTLIAKDQIISVYSGRPGCCCGCLGKHSYPSSPIARQVASKKRGYPIDDDEISDRTESLNDADRKLFTDRATRMNTATLSDSLEELQAYGYATLRAELIGEIYTAEMKNRAALREYRY